MGSTPGIPLDPRARAIIDAAFAAVSDGIAVFDVNAEMVDFNDAFWRFCRFTARGDAAHSITAFDEMFEVQTPDGDPVPIDRWGVMLALEGTEQLGASYRLRRRGTGDVWWGRFNAIPIKDDGNNIAGVLLTVRDTSEEERLLDKLRASQSQLRDLIAERERLQDEERKRISRELHDGLQQVLTALNLKLGMAEDAIADDPEAARRWLDEAQESVIETSQDIRDMIKALRPRGLAGRGLRDALDALTQSQEGLGLMTCEFSGEGLTGDEPDPEVGDCLYRVAQEALTNDGLGLVGMRERVAAVDGRLRVASEAGTGTTVEAIVPRHQIEGYSAP